MKPFLKNRIGSFLSSLLCALCCAPCMSQQNASTDAQKHEDAVQAQLMRVRSLALQKQRKDAPFVATWDSLAGYRTPKWFRDAKFGIFVHWGVYSVPAFGNEWYSRNMYVPGNKAFEHHVATYGPQSQFGYKDFIPEFKAEKFNAAEWVDLFARAGARYVVPVGEHCDGFSMYASKINPWNAAVMGPRRDVVGELSTATRAHGLKFGLSSHTAEHWWWYGLGRTFKSDVQEISTKGAHGLPPTAMLYGPASPMNLAKADGVTDDSKEPDPSHLERWMPPDKAFLDEWLGKSTEMVDLYHPDFMYFDWWIGQPAFKPALQQFAAYYYDRSRQRHQQPVLTYKEEAMPADTATLDIERGKMATLRLLPWQTDTSVSIHSWGYAEHDEYRSAKSLVQQLIDTVAKNGNLLLNVGPKADGTIPPEVITVLNQIGEWLHVNGEAIYGTRPFAVFGEGPTVAGKNSIEKNQDIQQYTPEDVRFTTGTTSSGEPVVYALLLGWPPSGEVTIHTLFAGNPYLSQAVCGVDLIGSKGRVTFKQQRDGLKLNLPPSDVMASLGDISYVLRLHTLCHH